MLNLEVWLSKPYFVSVNPVNDVTLLLCLKVNYTPWPLHPAAYLAGSWKTALKCAVCSFCKENYTGHLGVCGLSRERITVLRDTVIPGSQRWTPARVATAFVLHRGGREGEGGQGQVMPGCGFMLQPGRDPELRSAPGHSILIITPEPIPFSLHTMIRGCLPFAEITCLCSLQVGSPVPGKVNPYIDDSPHKESLFKMERGKVCHG